MGKEKKVLHWREAVHAAQTLFEIHTRPEDTRALLKEMGTAVVLSEKNLCREWYAFVHASLVYSLMAHAPNVVVVEYVRSTQILLEHIAGYSPEEADAFVDENFSAYLDFLGRNEAKLCAVLFLQRAFGRDDLRTMPKQNIAFVSGMMALTLSSILDTLEGLEIRATDGTAT